MTVSTELLVLRRTLTKHAAHSNRARPVRVEEHIGPRTFRNLRACAGRDHRDLDRHLHTTIRKRFEPVEHFALDAPRVVGVPKQDLEVSLAPIQVRIDDPPLQFLTPHKPARDNRLERSHRRFVLHGHHLPLQADAFLRGHYYLSQIPRSTFDRDLWKRFDQLLKLPGSGSNRLLTERRTLVAPFTRKDSFSLPGQRIQVRVG